MKIAIDARYAVRKRRGIGKYIINLIDFLARIETSHIFYIYIDDDTQIKGLFPQKDNFIVKVMKGNYLIWENILLPLRLYKDKIDLYHGTSNTLPLFAGRVETLVTIHDVMFLKASLSPGNFYQFLGFGYRKTNLYLTHKKAIKVITVSNYSKQDIITETSIPRSKIEVIWESYDDIFNNTNIAPYESKNPYVLTLGAIDPRKNTLLVVKIFALLKNNFPELKLIICGFQGWQNSDVHKEVQKFKLDNEVYFFEYVSDEELVSFYKGASLFLYPSAYEGFGVPPLEAMACTCPVITSGVTSIPEVVGDAAVVIEDFDEMPYFEACSKLLSDTAVRKELTDKGIKRISEFSWLKMAKETLNLYEEIEQIKSYE